MMHSSTELRDDPITLRDRARDAGRVRTYVLLALLAGLFVWSYQGSEINLGLLFSRDGGGALVGYVDRLFPPDISAKVVRDALVGAWETFAISLMGTLLAVVIALALVCFGSRNLVYAGLLYEMEVRGGLGQLVRRVAYMLTKSILNFLRTVPEMLWALIFVFIVGLGPFPGVLALGSPYRWSTGKTVC